MDVAKEEASGKSVIRYSLDFLKHLSASPLSVKPLGLKDVHLPTPVQRCVLSVLHMLRTEAKDVDKRDDKLTQRQRDSRGTNQAPRVPRLTVRFIPNIFSDSNANGECIAPTDGLSFGPPRTAFSPGSQQAPTRGSQQNRITITREGGALLD